jgi:hypothetical protein
LLGTAVLGPTGIEEGAEVGISEGEEALETIDKGAGDENKTSGGVKY